MTGSRIVSTKGLQKVNVVDDLIIVMSRVIYSTWSCRALIALRLSGSMEIPNMAPTNTEGFPVLAEVFRQTNR